MPPLSKLMNEVKQDEMAQIHWSVLIASHFPEFVVELTRLPKAAWII